MKLSEKRLSAGLQQKDVMEDISLYSKIENGKALAIEQDCERFSALFGCGLSELFDDSELLFFKKLLSLDKRYSKENKEFAEEEPKIVSAPICKSVKKHFEQLRKCYWLGKTRNAELKRIITARGFKTEQEWFSFIVDEEIEKAARSGGTDKGGKENISNLIIAGSEGSVK